MTRKLVLLCTAGLLAGGIGGCERASVEVDPYARASLHQVTYGPPVLSKDLKYKIVNPEIIDGVGDYVLAREGNVVTLIVGPGLVEKIEALPDKSILTFNVLKKFSPLVHFRCEMAIAGTDTTFLSKRARVKLPRMADAATFASADHPPTDMVRFKYNDTAGLGKDVWTKYALKAKLVRVTEADASLWLLLGSEPSARGQVPVLRVSTPTPEIEMVLQLIEQNGGQFDGGVTFSEVEPWARRQKNHICGTVAVDYVKFLNKVFKA